MGIEALSEGVKRPERETHASTAPSVKVDNASNLSAYLHNNV
jgi:hypothetical protein